MLLKRKQKVHEYDPRIVPLLGLFAVVIVSIFFLSDVASQEPIGGQTNEYGCLTGAGYSWDDNVCACIRPWELDEGQREAARIAVLPLSYRVTVIGVDVFRCPGCFEVHLQRNDNGERFSVKLSNWKFQAGDSGEDANLGGGEIIEEYIEDESDSKSSAELMETAKKVSEEYAKGLYCYNTYNGASLRVVSFERVSGPDYSGTSSGLDSSKYAAVYRFDVSGEGLPEGIVGVQADLVVQYNVVTAAKISWIDEAGELISR
ncbi:MAG: hypothetical protein ACP5E4_01615 [Candidatus Aenigmatarchaeota archaeon]